MTEYYQNIGVAALSNIKGVGPAFIKKYVSNKYFLTNNLYDDIRTILDEGKMSAESEEILYQIEVANKLEERSLKEGIHIVSILSDAYPKELKALKDNPGIIFCVGNLELLNKPTVCIIGSRESNENGERIASRIGRYFSNHKYSICNGLSDGIDSFAIQEDGFYFENSIGILAGGLNYGSKNTLQKKTSYNADKVLSSNGLLITEKPIDKKEDTFSVVKSCRLQAGISQGLILVQSSLSGGSKFAIKAFSELVRPLAAVRPVNEDDLLDSYSANIALINSGKAGISEITDLKLSKILLSKIMILKSKDDYKYFEEAMNNVQDKSIVKPTLF